MDQQRPVGPMSDDDFGLALAADLEDACMYADTELGPLRAAAIHYYHARPFGDEENGRSKVVMPLVRDTIRATLPSLMRKFFGSKQVVSFTPGSRQGGDFATDATATVNYVFTVQNDGYTVLWNAMKSALREKSGWIKWWWEEKQEVSATTYSGVTEDQLIAIHGSLYQGESLQVVSKTPVGTRQVPAPLPQGAMQNNAGAPMGGAAPVTPGPLPAVQQAPAPSPTQGLLAPPQAPPQGAPGPQGPMPPQMPPQPPMQMVPETIYEYEIRIECRRKKKQVRVAAVPNDEIIYPHDNFDIDTGRMIAHRTRKTRGELVAMGVNPDDLESVPSDDMDTLTNVEFLARQTIPSAVMTQSTQATWDQVMVPYYEAYYRIDKDGDGISELRKVCRIGRSGVIVDDDIVDEVPLAQLCPDPEPFVLTGNSQADHIMDLQSINSHVWRDLLDSLKQSIFPRMAYVEGQANLEDVLNTEIGAAIRMRAPGMVQPLTVPFSGQAAMPILENLDQVREQRTGIGAAAMALDGAALQSTTPVAAAASVTAAQSQVEMIARLFATPLSRMFRGILRLLVKHQDQEMYFDLNGQSFVVNPVRWNPDLHAVVDAGLGMGSNTGEQVQTLEDVANLQSQIILQLGPNNPLCGLTEYYNTLCARMEAVGIRDTHKYWKNPTGQQMPPPSPSQAEILAGAQMRIEGAKLDKDRLKIILDDERNRDQMEMNARLQAAEIRAKYGAQFDTKTIDGLIARERNDSQERIAALAQQAPETQDGSGS